MSQSVTRPPKTILSVRNRLRKPTSSALAGLQLCCELDKCRSDSLSQTVRLKPITEHHRSGLAPPSECTYTLIFGLLTFLRLESSLNLTSDSVSMALLARSSAGVLYSLGLHVHRSVMTLRGVHPPNSSDSKEFIAFP